MKINPYLDTLWWTCRKTKKRENFKHNQRENPEYLEWHDNQTDGEVPIPREARRQRHGTFKVLKGNNCEFKILFVAKL